MTGYFKIQHGILDHYIFKDEPFTEREAWIWLIDSASFESHKVRYKSKLISVKRGEIPTSFRKLQDRWKWGVHRVFNFIELLNKEGMIETQTDNGFLTITICNYNKYQDNGSSDTTQTATQTATDTATDTITQTATNIIKGKKGKEREINTQVLFDQFWQEFPQNKRSKGSKKDAKGKFESALKKDSFNNIIQGVKSYEGYIRSTGQSNQDAYRWLEKERWRDDYTIQSYQGQSNNAGGVGKSKHQRAKEALGIA